MSGRTSALVLLLGTVALGTLSCDRGTGRSRESDQQAALGGEVAARVGADVIPLSLVASVAADQKLSARAALNELVDDAICANGARGRELDRAPPATWLLTAARARWTTDHMLDAARAKGPPTDAEIAELTLRHWREVDRPPAVRVIHALAMRPKTAGDEARARALAADLRAAVVSATSEAEFDAKAKAVAHPADLTVRVEALPAFAADGDLMDQQGGMVEAFAKAAFAIPEVGGTSGVVESEFGWHVIRLVEKIAEQRMPLEARRAAFAQEALLGRAHEQSAARIKELRDATPVAIEPTAENLMQSLFTGDALAGRAP